MTGASGESRKSFFSEQFLAALNGYTPESAFERIFEEAVSSARLDRQMYLDSKTYLPGDILVKVDRMSMAHSIETRSPLLDHHLIEFAQTIPASLKLVRSNKRWETKYILKRAVAGLIPDEIIYRQKKGFSVPIKYWLNRDMKGMAHDLLGSPRARQRGYFNPTAVAGLLQEHNRGTRDHAHSLWALLMLEIWRRMFIDREPAARFTGAKSGAKGGF